MCLEARSSSRRWYRFVDVVNSHAVRDSTGSACTPVVAEQSNTVNHVPVDSAADARNVSRVMRSSHRSNEVIAVESDHAVYTVSNSGGSRGKVGGMHPPTGGPAYRVFLSVMYESQT